MDQPKATGPQRWHTAATPGAAQLEALYLIWCATADQHAKDIAARTEAFLAMNAARPRVAAARLGEARPEDIAALSDAVAVTTAAYLKAHKQAWGSLETRFQAQCAYIDAVYAAKGGTDESHEGTDLSGASHRGRPESPAVTRRASALGYADDGLAAFAVVDGVQPVEPPVE